MRLKIGECSSPKLIGECSSPKLMGEFSMANVPWIMNSLVLIYYTKLRDWTSMHRVCQLVYMYLFYIYLNLFMQSYLVCTVCLLVYVYLFDTYTLLLVCTEGLLVSTCHLDLDLYRRTVVHNSPTAGLFLFYILT